MRRTVAAAGLNQTGSLVLLLVRVGHELRDRVAHHPDASFWGNFNFDFCIPDFGDLADQSSLGDNRVAACERFDHRLVLFHFLLLRADQQEIHDHEDQDQWHNACKIQTTPGRLSICGIDEHFVPLSDVLAPLSGFRNMA